MEVRRSPRLRAGAVTNILQHPVASPLQPGVLTDAVARNDPAPGPSAPPPEETSASDSSIPASDREVRQGDRGMKRKSSNIREAGYKAIRQAIENGSRTIADSIDRAQNATAQIAEDRVHNLEALFQTELKYLKKRDRKISRNQKDLIKAINEFTAIVTTRINNTARPAGDTSQEIGAGDTSKERGKEIVAGGTSKERGKEIVAGDTSKERGKEIFAGESSK